MIFVDGVKALPKLLKRGYRLEENKPEEASATIL